jgi:DNA-directed RNA polymerase subunit beta'
MSKLVSKKSISESRAKKINPTLLVYGKEGELIRSYNLPVGPTWWLKTVRKLKQVKYCKNPRRSSKSEILLEVYLELQSC